METLCCLHRCEFAAGYHLCRIIFSIHPKPNVQLIIQLLPRPYQIHHITMSAVCPIRTWTKWTATWTIRPRTMAANNSSSSNTIINNSSNSNSNTCHSATTRRSKVATRRRIRAIGASSAKLSSKWCRNRRHNPNKLNDRSRIESHDRETMRTKNFVTTNFRCLRKETHPSVY